MSEKPESAVSAFAEFISAAGRTEWRRFLKAERDYHDRALQASAECDSWIEHERERLRGPRLDSADATD